MLVIATLGFLALTVVLFFRDQPKPQWGIFTGFLAVMVAPAGVLTFVVYAVFAAIAYLKTPQRVGWSVFWVILALLSLI